MTTNERIILDSLEEIAKRVYPLFMQPADAAEGIVKKREALVMKLAKVIHDEDINKR